ncbi:MAG: T9SS type A sorting domain-containing protein, partial [Candidatus Kapabacteria bacterium]|nr:T9SS type A sorting domain-containing protein [Candidatus Kapabacteria bacterium]
STSDWSNSWQFRTTVDRPKLRYPNKGSKTEDIDLISRWDTVKEATDYFVEVSKSSDYSQIIYSSKTSDLDKQNLKNLEFNTTYYWHVRGKNDEGTGEWSENWDFKTGVQPPLLVAPDSGKANMPTTVIFRWSTSKNATSYHLQVSEKADFSSLHFDSSTLTDVQQEVKGLSKYTTYYWRVLTKVGSFESPYGNVWNIKTLMDTTKLIEPLNKKQDVAQSVNLKWLPTKGAVFYQLQISRNETYTNIMYDDSSITQTQKDIIFPYDSTFYWRVKAKSLEGKNEWSEQWSFKTTINSVEDDLASSSFVFYPNPFDENLTINFSLIKDAKVQIKVIDVSGREIAILKDNYVLSGEQKLEWKPIGISKGIYYLHVKIGESISLREVRFGK